MPASVDAGLTITVHGDASTSRRSGRIRKPTAKLRVIEQVNCQISKLSNYVQGLLRRDAERDH
ncbi:hypothetical protein CCHR01_20011 [Colletotrichum chrysophilum]|uniref:Uncharacterized protein n=1 Tax=Colletotrichum chrysophilum TaxID=1836956 RepID=A0AAD8ZXA3_9PEZI|nr:hypothetical protein CCHR01_20011 [Colletotrichum chrysophilum]